MDLYSMSFRHYNTYSQGSHLQVGKIIAYVHDGGSIGDHLMMRNVAQCSKMASSPLTEPVTGANWMGLHPTGSVIDRDADYRRSPTRKSQTAASLQTCGSWGQ